MVGSLHTIRQGEAVTEFALIRASAISFAMHLVFGVVAIVIGAIVIQLIDRVLLKRLDLEEEIARGNLAAALFAGSVWIALALILSRSS
jgi:uncharacterized membrane protein YjfL (UPF0719 family)